MTIFKQITEQNYYSRNNNIKSIERTFDSSNRFRLSYYLNGNNVLVYYMGRYYASTALQSGMEEIDLINLILLQCSDPYKVKADEDLNDLE